MEGRREPAVILMADDDEDDFILVRDAFRENGLYGDLRFVEDGEELMDYLYRRGKYSDAELAPHPDLILLDLNMPRKDGRKALKEIKADPHLRTTPVVILTTSQEDEDILQSYETGASSFITKPVSFRGLLDLARTLGSYWLETVQLPPQKTERRN